MDLISYDELRKGISGRSHLLLGNGFSIGCDPVFRYQSLYEAAVHAGLSERAQSVFARLGTNNFEGVMRLLTDTEWVSKTYGLLEDDADTEMAADVEIVKRALVEAVASSHLPHTGHVSEEKKAAAAAFFNPFYNIFTTNYDLVCYWVNMFVEPPPYEDGFAPDHDEPDLPWVVFDGAIGRSPGMYFLHGALHIYMVGGEVRKHSYARSMRPLTDLIREALAENQYPLFVAEGDAEKKLDQIGKSGYLWYCLEKFGRVKGPIVVYGHSLGDSDRHIANAIADNRDLPVVAVGLYGDPDTDGNRLIRANVERIKQRRRRLIDRLGGEDLEVIFYASDSVGVWGS